MDALIATVASFLIFFGFIGWLISSGGEPVSHDAGRYGEYRQEQVLPAAILGAKIAKVPFSPVPTFTVLASKTNHAAMGPSTKR